VSAPGPAPIRATDRVADVLARDEALVEAFVAVSPAFARLRNPALRRVMARLVTVAQAARVAGVDAALLVERLNRALAGAPNQEPEPMHEAPPCNHATAVPAELTPMPACLAALPAERLLELDVRDDLRNGREPFHRIMEARRALAAGQVLRLRAIFEPAPLYTVLGKQGFTHWTERLAADDWRIWFWRPEETGETAGGLDADGSQAQVQAPAAERPPAPEPAPEERIQVLDVRGLEPPEPMVRTLAVLETLPAGHTLVQVNVRVPEFLLPQLQQRGFTYEIHEQADGAVRLFIHRPAAE
jgi:uncharacterized protein (DUF2249 family)